MESKVAKRAFKYEGDMDEMYRPQGKGVGFYNATEVYSGHYEKGFKHGYGEYKYSNGDFYHGNWVNGRREGQGTYSYSDNSIYKGNWDNDMKHDSGMITYDNGDVYEGKWSKGQKNGDGIFHFSEFDVAITSKWSDGVRQIKEDRLLDETLNIDHLVEENNEVLTSDNLNKKSEFNLIEMENKVENVLNEVAEEFEDNDAYICEEEESEKLKDEGVSGEVSRKTLEEEIKEEQDEFVGHNELQNNKENKDSKIERDIIQDSINENEKNELFREDKIQHNDDVTDVSIGENDSLNDYSQHSKYSDS